MLAKMRSKGTLIGLAALLVAVSGLMAACSTPSASAQTPEPAAGSEHVISVSGTGEASGRPDVAYVELGIDVTDEDFSAALDEANSTMDGVRQAVMDQGVAQENIQTTQFNVWVEELRDPQSGALQGGRVYHVVNMLRVKVLEIDNTGDIISAGLDAGANTVNSLSFSIDESDALEADARVNAVADARDRAQQLADAMGVSLGDPVYISEGTSGGGPVIERMAMADAGLGGGPSISEGQLTVSVTVNVSFLIEQ